MRGTRFDWLDRLRRRVRQSTTEFVQASLWGLAAGVLTLTAIGGYAFDRHEHQQLRKEASGYLGAVAGLKAREMDAWLDERHGDALIASRTPVFSRAAAARLAGESGGELEAAALAQAFALRRVYRYSEVFLVATDGRLLLGTDQDPESLTDQTAAAVRAALASGLPHFSDLWAPREGESPLLDLAAPLHGTGSDADRVIGAVVLRIDPRLVLWPLLAAWPDSFYRGRLALLRPQGSAWVLFDVTRAATGEALRLQPGATAPDSVYSQVALGNTATAGPDDAGREVLAAAQHVADWPWTLVATIPVADVRERGGRATLLAMGWILAVLGGAALLARRYARQLSDDAVRASEDRLRISQALAHSGSWEWHPRTQRFAFSAELPRILGLPAEPPPSAHRLLRQVPAAGRHDLLAALRATLADGKRASLEHDVRRGDGQLRIVQHEANRYADSKGLTVRLVGVIVDVTEHRRAELALRESDAALQNVFEHMQDAFMRVELGAQGRVLSANPAAVRMLGWEHATDLVGKSLAEELTVDPEESRSLRLALSSSGVAHHQRFSLRRRDGSHVLVEGNVRLIRDAAQEPYALEGVLRDMSLHDQRQAELVAAREAALGAAQVKARFLANISHEIRTPLNAIVGLSHLLSLALLPPRERDMVQKVQGAARNLLDLINGVLDFSKLEAGKLQLSAAPFYLDEVLDAVANVVAVEAQQKGLELLFAISEGVPMALIGDAVRLRQVLTNLAHNAVKFTNAGEVVVGVERIETAGANARLSFSVRDSGIGLAPEVIPKLFGAFTQADDSATRRFGGTGLGLAISAELVQLMAGRIDVRSAPGAGSTFSFVIELPLSSAQRQPAVPAALSRARVLVVDDHAASLLVLGRYLRDLGCSVDTAGSGLEALRLLDAAEQAGRPFQLLLLDWRMPGLNGLDTARRAKSELQAPPPIILVTAYEAEAAAEAGLLDGVEALLTKPVTRSALLDAIARARGQTVAPVEVVAPPPSLRGARVLLAEDNEINQQVARQLLESAGIDVRIAADGREALAVVTEAGAHYDAVLMDLQMPGMDGFEATRAIRGDARFAALPIIAMTAHTLEAEKQSCLDAGMNAHVAKPVDPAELFRALARWVKKTRDAAPPPTHVEIPGIDFKAALQRVRNNRGLLLRLLAELARTWRDGDQRIRSLLTRAELDEARRTAHTLKGAAGNLGAAGLAAAAGRVERALANSDPASAAAQDTNAAIDGLEGELRAVCAALDERLPALTA